MKQLSNLTIMSAGLAAGLVLSGCRKDKAAETSNVDPSAKLASKATKPTTAESGKGTAKNNKEASEEGSASSPCETILANGWNEMQPAFALVGQDASPLKKYYLKDRSFIKKCKTLATEKLSCLSASKTPIADYGKCKVNEGLTGSSRLWMPRITPSSSRQKVPEADQASTLTSVVGTWKNSWKENDSETTWKISKSGDVKETVKRKGETKTKEFKILFDRPDKVQVMHNPTSSQWYGYFRADKKTMYVSSNLSYKAHAAESDKKFVLEIRGGRLVYDATASETPVCKIFADRGALLDGKCSWSNEGKMRLFELDFQEPGAKNPSHEKLYFIAGRLLDYRLVSMGTFRKKS